MPEASVDKQTYAPSREHEIRVAGQIAPVQPKPQPPGVEVSAHGHLGCRIPASDTAHIAATCFRCQLVHNFARLCEVSLAFAIFWDSLALVGSYPTIGALWGNVADHAAGHTIWQTHTPSSPP